MGSPAGPLFVPPAAILIRKGFRGTGLKGIQEEKECTIVADTTPEDTTQVFPQKLSRDIAMSSSHIQLLCITQQVHRPLRRTSSISVGSSPRIRASPICMALTVTPPSQPILESMSNTPLPHVLGNMYHMALEEHPLSVEQAHSLSLMTQIAPTL